MSINNDFVSYFASTFMGFLAIMNPIANAPVFLGLTEGYDSRQKKIIALKAATLAFCIVTVFCFFGSFIFEIFGISIAAFRVTGGLLVSFIGMNMLQGENSTVQHPTEMDQESAKKAALTLAVSPLAIPILSGPGTIATAISYTASQDTAHILCTVFSLACVVFLNFISFHLGEKIVNFLGEAGINVITRIMGLILAVIGIQMLSDGIFELIKMNS